MVRDAATLPGERAAATISATASQGNQPGAHRTQRRKVVSRIPKGQNGEDDGIKVTQLLRLRRSRTGQTRYDCLGPVKEQLPVFRRISQGMEEAKREVIS